MSADEGPGWLAPEATVDGAPATPRPTTGAPPGPLTAAAPGAAGGGPVQIPVPLRPLTVADVLDGAFGILRAQPAKVLSIAALFSVPIYLVSAFLQRGILDGVGIASFFADDPSADVLAAAEDDGGAGAVWAAVLQFLGPSLVLPFVAAALAVLTASWYAGRDLSTGDSLRAAGRSWWPLLASWVLVHLVEGAAALACVVPMLFVVPMFVCVAPAIALERLGTVAALRRSWRLARRRYWPTFGAAMLTGAVAYVLTQTLPVLPSSLALFIGLDVGWVLLGLGGALTSLIVLPMVAGSAVLIYLDLRVRTEGLDIELDARRAFGMAS